mmetsp:Transcript_36981/g.97925  ORF Transcript_36981/g.97925 Transcript_36981/m.97925 type:complete len:130 (+) Transcript_36981:447-836(+)
MADLLLSVPFTFGCQVGSSSAPVLYLRESAPLSTHAATAPCSDVPAARLSEQVLQEAGIGLYRPVCAQLLSAPTQSLDSILLLSMRMLRSPSSLHGHRRCDEARFLHSSGVAATRLGCALAHIQRQATA